MEIKIEEKCEILSKGKNKELALIWQRNTHNLEKQLYHLDGDQNRQKKRKKKNRQEEKREILSQGKNKELALICQRNTHNTRS